MRPIWKGAISFGLINIPVKVFSAVEESTLDLDMLDSRDHAAIKFKRVNADTGKEVKWEDIVRAYDYNGKYIVLDPEDFEKADVEKTNTIDILHFVEESEIDSVYYEQPYYLEPEKQGIKAYGILRDALKSTGKVGVTSFVMRTKEHLAILKPMGKMIVLNRIRFEEEIRDTTGFNLPAVSAKKTKEQAIANQLIEQQTEKFNIAKYKDTYTAKLMKVIKEKAKRKGKDKPTKQAKLKIVHKQSEDDLMSLLKASLGGKKKAG